MKRSKKEIESKIRSITMDLLCWAGLKNAKKITEEVRQNVKSVKQVIKTIKENLKAEEKRRKKN